MDQAEWKLLKEIAELEKTPQGAYNIRRNGALDSRNSTANIEITTKTEPGKSGIDIRIKPGTRHESVHIPVIISQTGLSEMVYNDFFIGEDCDVDIVAGCGIHNTGCETSQHDGVHTFYVGKNSKVRYVERHYGEGPGTGKRIMNPQTVVYLEEGATINLESKGMLKDRVYGVAETLFHDPYYQRHVVGLPHITAMTEEGIITRTNYVIFRTKADGHSEVFNVGYYLDKVVQTAEGLRFASRLCIFDSELVPNSLIYPI